jgi:tetratricopeptide (TPR) repeat protein
MLGEYERALEDISAALEHGDFREVSSDPDKERTQAHVFRGHAYQRLGQFELALEDYEQVMRIEPDHPAANYCRWTALLCMGDADLAAREAEGAIWRVSPKGTEPAYIAMYGYLAYCQMNRDEEAKELLDRVPRRSDRSEWPFPLIDFLAGRLTAKAMLDTAVDLEKMTEAQAILGLKRALSHRPEDARKHLLWTVEHGARDFLEVDLAAAELEHQVFSGVRPVAAKPELPDLEDLPAGLPELRPLPGAG